MIPHALVHHTAGPKSLSAAIPDHNLGLTRDWKWTAFSGTEALGQSGAAHRSLRPFSFTRTSATGMGASTALASMRPAARLEAYWGTHMNTPNQVSNTEVISGTWYGTEYWFIIYPQSGGSNGCQFVVQILDTGFNSKFSYTYDVDDNTNVTGADSGFCSTIESESSGFYTATLQYTPTITSIDTTDIHLTVYTIKAGK